MLFASLCNNNPSEYMDVMQLMPNPEANVPVASDVMECALMTLQ